LFEILHNLELVLEGELSRESVGDWASQYIMNDSFDVSNERVWDLLQIVSGIDLKDSPDQYLHLKEDIFNWNK